MLENTPQTNSLYAKIEELLKSIPELVTEEKELRYNKIKEMAESGDAILLIPLMQNAEIKNAFFTPILDSFVFKTKEFKEFLDYSSSNNSYSQYLGKKIGLYCGDSALTDRNEVVLNFPFKDCVLEGGQKKEDGLDTYFEYDEKTSEYVKKQSKRREVFFNETLAKDEIDNLFSPKVFCNVKKYTTDGEASCVDFTRNAEVNKKRGLSEDTITDNLIVKGNNLLALHSLKTEFEGKIKLIYIDPPYNTGSDGFSYNDNFNHSSWLTFMKNRLEVAKDLLRDDGCIFVQCDDNEQAYLKVLMDEILGRENFVANCPRKTRGSATTKSNAELQKLNDYLLIYWKNRSESAFNLRKKGEKKYPNIDERGKFYIVPLQDNGPHGTRTARPNLYYPIYKTKNGKFNLERENPDDVEILPKQHKNDDGTWMWSKKKFSSDNIDLYEEDGVMYIKHYFNENEDQNIYEQERTWLDNFQNSKGTIALNEVFGEKGIFNNPKPEELMSFVLGIGSDEHDIILDYHLGSGTTAAVAHKMNRQYIGVEQMDYIKTISCERLKKVIEGEQGGISKSVNWQGGGSFVYMELAEKNEKAMQLISACKNYDELVSIFNTLSTKYFLHYNVRINDFINKTCKEEQFKNLSLEKQKEIFCRMLDLNQLYVNCNDRNDKDSGLSEKDIKATENFYQIQKDGE